MSAEQDSVPAVADPGGTRLERPPALGEQVPGEPRSPAATASAWVVPGWLDVAAKWTWRLLVLGAGVLALLWTLSVLRVVVLPVLIALLLTALSAPLAERLKALRVPRLLAAWLSLLAVLGALAGLAYLVWTSVGERLTTSVEWREIGDDVRLWLQDGPLGLSGDEIDRLTSRARDALVGGIQNAGMDRARLAAEIVGGAFLSLVLFFFFTKDGPAMWRWLTNHIRPRRRATIDRAGRAAFEALKGYVGGVAITGVVDAVAIGLALWVIGIPLVIPLAVLTFFAAFFPIVGATAAGALATVVALATTGVRAAVLVAIVTLVIQQLEGDLILPVVMRRRVNLHPAVILVVLGIGGALAGVVGAFVAVPMAAMITSALAAARRADTTPDAPEASSNGAHD